MRRGLGIRSVAFLLAAGLVAMSSGCAEWLALSSFVSFGAGWLVRDATIQTHVIRECYQNGVQVDCDDLPGG